jgi:type II secretory pathway pseudopilin PulG
VKNTAGVTLTSFVLVLAVIGILSAILLPTVADIGQKTNTNRMKADLRSLKTALCMYRVNYGEFPAMTQDEWEDPDRNLLLRMEPRIIDSIPEDPYNPGHSYQYELYQDKDWQTPVYIVYTVGPDGKGNVWFQKKRPDEVEIRKGATAAFITNAAIVELKPKP